jgi:adenylate kinase
MNISEYDAIFIIGPQGSGKGTQGKLLAQKLGFFYWEMGEILRSEAKQDTEFGRKVKAMINEGQLVPDEDVIRTLDEALPEIIKHKRVVFDGITRRIGQTEYLVSFLKQNGFTQFATIVIDVPEEESVKRLLLRAHHEFRTDDTPEKIKFRLQQYAQDTLPAINFLDTVGRLYKIDGVGSVEEITQRINQAMDID